MKKIIVKDLHKIARVIRKRVTKVPKPPEYRTPDTQYQGESASKLIREMLSKDKACMICRMGHTELKAILTYLDMKKYNSEISRLIHYITGDINNLSWERDIIKMENYSGFFPSNAATLEKFSEKMLLDIKDIDILGSWLYGELSLLSYFPNAKTTPLADLEPYYHKNPWSSVLEGKKVLVIHPFEETIRAQYEKRKYLFKDPRILPEFELLTLKAVQSIAGNKVEYATWFEALEWMCDKIDKINFDVAIIGAGAYGLPLAAHVKRIGKKGIHLGGATQILFGIKGKRWDSRDFFKELYNDYWTRPLDADTPRNFEKVDSGCYW